MLRTAMRLTKVDEATAKAYAAKAYANGVITTNDDDCYLMHTGGVTTNDSSEPYARFSFMRIRVWLSSTRHSIMSSAAPTTRVFL